MLLLSWRFIMKSFYVDVSICRLSEIIYYRRGAFMTIFFVTPYLRVTASFMVLIAPMVSLM